VIRVKLYREVHRANIIETSVETRFYVSSLIETAEEFAKRQSLEILHLTYTAIMDLIIWLKPNVWRDLALN